jgi:hypothetical protein
MFLSSSRFIGLLPSIALILLATACGHGPSVPVVHRPLGRQRGYRVVFANAVS